VRRGGVRFRRCRGSLGNATSRGFDLRLDFTFALGAQPFFRGVGECLARDRGR